jgi:predicted phage baseplate assembly protein
MSSAPLQLDDRRWTDLVEEGRALIPLYAPEWTDHNVHDPGVTLMELLAWIAEMSIYRTNRIPEAHRRKFLALVGIVPRPPVPACTAVSFALAPGAAPLGLPRGTELGGVDLAGAVTRFTTAASITIVGAGLAAVLVHDGAAFRDLGARLRAGEAVLAFGPSPVPSAALYLGFDAPLPPGEAIGLWFEVAGPRADREERRRLVEEAGAGTDASLTHHDARTVWEYLAAGGVWRPLAAEDRTRAFSLSGPVRLTAPAGMARARLGSADADLAYVRCRLASGAHDAPPVLSAVLANAVGAEQSTPAHVAWTVARGVFARGAVPARGARARLRFHLDAAGAVDELEFVGDHGGPVLRVLDFRPATPMTPGRLVLEAALAGVGTGAPHQRMALPDPPVVAASLRVHSLEGDAWRTWRRREDLAASRADDLDFVLDAARGTLVFGDGARGRVPPPGALVVAVYRATRAEAGNVRPGVVDRLEDSPRNQALLGDVAAAARRLAGVANLVAARGGLAAETLPHAIGRAVVEREQPRRAVTLGDYETLAMETPGVRLARVAARANLHPRLACLRAPGVVTVLVVPDLPGPRPTPSPGLRRAVAAYLGRRRIVGTRVEVVGPGYVEVAVHGRVQALPGAARAAVRAAVVAALDAFLDPRTGGPEGGGWPFGRDVYRPEMLAVIDAVPGVHHVDALVLVADGGEPRCGNLCLPDTWLVTPGAHEIEVA